MDKQQFNKAFNNAKKRLSVLAPKDTGHLALNAIKGKWVGKNHYVIYIDADVLINNPNIRGKIAGYDYAYEINNNPRYRTYNFFEKIGYKVAQGLAKELGGTLKK